MTGPATYASDEGIAERARRKLDRAAGRVSEMEAAQRSVIGALVELWPDSGWRAAGVRSPKDWLLAHTGQSAGEAHRLAKTAELCTLSPVLGDAVIGGTFPIGWAERLSRSVTADRAPYLTDKVVDAFLGLATAGVPDDQFGDAVRFWADKVDQEVKPRRAQRQSLVATQSLFGGGELHANLSPGAFENVLSAVGAFTQNPDASDAPYQRTLSERRADALDDLAHFGLTHGDEDGCLRNSDASAGWDDEVVPDGFDDPDILIDLLDCDDGRTSSPGDPGAYMTAVRKMIRRRVECQDRRVRRQLKPRSGARIDITVDLATFLGLRELDDFEGLVRRRPPRHCDAHHLVERESQGPTVVDNGCLLCRYHHRLIHLYEWKLSHDDQWRWTATDAHGQTWTERKPG